tara:strand:+ start:343 stop:1164 length:822 start_codon:yes stop_codon:yes gene_type:complete
MLVKWLQNNSSEQIWRTGKKSLKEKGYYSCDLTNAPETKSLIAKLRPQLIFHLAGNYVNTHDLDYSINSLGAKHIIEALIEEGINTRVILIGSAAEYGIVSPNENPIKENRVLCPVTVYGLSKAFQTQLGIYFAQNSNIEILIARMFNLQTPGLSEKLFIGRMEKQISAFLRGEIKEIVAGNLDSQRDYISADKAIEQLNMIAKKGKSGEVYHIASGQPIKMKELLHKMLLDARIDPSKIKEDIGAIGKIDYDVPVIYADMTKTNKLKNINES